MGLAGKKIPLGSRIITLADSMDAMTSQRSYRDPMPINDALEEIEENEAGRFDPELIGPFVSTMRSNINLN